MYYLDRFLVLRLVSQAHPPGIKLLLNVQEYFLLFRFDHHDRRSRG